MCRHLRQSSAASPEWHTNYMRLQRIENAVRYWNGGVQALQEQVTEMAYRLSARELEATALLNVLGNYFADMAKLFEDAASEVHDAQ